ncbi:MAG: hypothetical protein ACU0BF_09690 [Paracoccaceae bacterium]
MQIPRITAQASPARRLFALGVLYGLGLFVLALAVNRPPSPAYLILQLALGLGALALAERMRRSTSGPMTLDGGELRDGQGRLIARLDEVASIDRGAFAFKPSGGFLLRLTTPAPRAWVPGLWWRMGRRVGVGGLLARAPARAVAEAIAFALASRDRAP